MAEIDSGMIDLTELFKRLCLESNIRYDGETMIVPRAQWERWQAGLLREYLEDDTEDTNANQEPTEG